MRWLAPLVVLAALATAAIASPKVAVVTLYGDSSDGQLTGVVRDEAAKHATVTDGDVLEQIMQLLAIEGIPDAKEMKRLRAKLHADAIVTGKIEKDGARLKLTLTATGRKGKGQTFVVRFAKSSSPAFRKELAAAIQKHVTAVYTKPAPGEDDDVDAAKPAVVKNNAKTPDAPAVHDAPDKPEDDPLKTVASADKPDADADGDGAKLHASVTTPLDASDRNVVTRGALFLDAGGAGLRRSLTYDASATGTPPPSVGNAAFSAQVEGAYYHGHFGIAGTLRQAVGVSLDVPATSLACPVDEALYTIGVRYRVAVGAESSLAFGLDYWRYRYIADRTSLGGMPSELDMPDVDYSALAPGATLKYGPSQRTALFGSLLVPIALSSGDLSAYGGSGGVGVAFDGGIDYALGAHYGLRLDAVFDQVGISFDQTNSVAMTRGLQSATDRTVGVAVTLAVMY